MKKSCAYCHTEELSIHWCVLVGTDETLWFCTPAHRQAYEDES